MLNKETKKKIDDARDTLVGVLPLPTDQIELITIALIYKFMDDQDEELRQVGLQEKFFVGELKEFSWQQLMSNQLSADQRVTKFINGIEAIQKSKQVPNLFREIFQNAFLKFRDGKVLQRFLDIINSFAYDHSEELGNSFEYLLMTMGAQGDNGQFRTPRNIIDFMVEVVDPQKNETILDPACGTGGFLVSSFKHILKRNTTGYETAKVELENYVAEGIPVYWGAKLSSPERNNIEKNIVGYDNTPLMVRLARVNLYLHHFGNPQIHEYNTLNTDTRWKDKFDCILANPPFMTPKGGIEPHDKFRIPANRTEILFSSYILQHLNPDGKAAFVVPEGIIFQTSGDYVTLRNWLIYEAGLWAVVSLPSNIFQPYSGVKTSIVFIDREIARKRKKILLVKIDNDGFSLNTNRNPIKENDLPDALEWMDLCKKNIDQFINNVESKAENPFVHKLRLLHRDEFAKLDNYKSTSTVYSFCKKNLEKAIKTRTEIELQIDLEKIKLTEEKNKAKIQKSEDLIKLLNEKTQKLITDFTKRVGSDFLFQDESGMKKWFDNTIKTDVIEYGSNLVNTNKLSKDLIDLLDNNREFVLSFDRFGENKFGVTSKFEIVKLGDICNIYNGSTPSRTESKYWNNGNIPWFTIDDIRAQGRIIRQTIQHITTVGFENTSVKLLPKETILICCTASVGEYAFTEIELTTNQQFNGLVVKDEYKDTVLPKYLFYISASFKDELFRLSGETSIKFVSVGSLKTMPIPLPPIEIQLEIIEEIERYSIEIEKAKNIQLENEDKIKTVLNIIWE